MMSVRNDSEAHLRSVPFVKGLRFLSAGEQFVEAGTCLADDPGNIHLRLGAKYNWTAIGKREPGPLNCFSNFLSIGKTKPAQLRGQFLQERILSGQAEKPEFRMTPEISDRLIPGYGQILGPRFLLGRCRYAPVRGWPLGPTHRESC